MVDDGLIKLWSQVKYFSPGEFDDPSEPGSGYRMNIEFVKLLDLIRGDCGFPFPIHSGVRLPVHNISVGGKVDSAHLPLPTESTAADVGCYDSCQRFALVSAAVKRGVKRIGIGSTFVHIDGNLDLPQQVIWLYPPKATATNQIPKEVV